MEQKWNNEAQAGIESRRERIASWIQNSLRPVDRLMKYDGLFPNTSSEIEDEVSQFEVREYQLDAWGALWDARQRGEAHGLVHLATGLGKTSVAVLDAMKFREEFRSEHGRNPKIMFTVHQNDILDQAAERFKAFIPDASRGYYNGNEKNIDEDITFATIQSLYANLDSLDPRAFDYIIDDEVHHAKAHTFEKVVEHFKPQFRLGLTATPDRADDKNIRDIYGNELYSKDLAEALSEDLLATPDYHIVFDDAVKEAMQSDFVANSLKALKELFDAKPRNSTIADNIRQEMEKIGLEFGSVKTIVFCQDIKHADEMADLLGGKPYHSEINSKDRKNIFDKFKNGDLQVITTRDMFNEGVDVPDARLLVFLRSTSSQAIFEQQLGRGLRKAIGKDRVSVLDFVANVERIAMVKDLADKIKRPRNMEGQNSSDDDLVGDTIGDNNFEPTENRFIIQTNHGEFDFDRMTVDFLEKYKWLTTESLAPNGYLTVAPISKSLGIPTSQFRKITENLNITGTILRNKHSSGVFYSPEEQSLIANVVNSYETVDHTYLSDVQLGDDLGISASSIRATAEKLEIEAKLLRRDNGRLSYLYSPNQQEIIAQYTGDYPRVAEGYISIEPLAKSCGVGPKTIQKAVETLDIDGIMMRPKTGMVTIFYSPEEQKQIFDFVTSLDSMYAPSTYATIGNLSKDSGWSYSMVANAAKRLGVTGEKMPVRSAGGVMSTVFSPEEQAAIIKELDKYPRVIEGYLPAVPLSKKLGVSRKTISSNAKALGIIGQKMQGKSSVGIFYSPEEQIAIKKYLEAKRK